MLQIAIVEDDDQAAALLEAYLQRYNDGNGTDYIPVRFQNGLSFISSYHPVYEAVFMDIRMPHMDGMEAAKKLRQCDENVALVFVTNMARYAIKGYEVNALDFMLKPVSYYEFQMKMNKAVEYAKKHQDRMLLIETEDMMKRVSIRDITYIEVRNHSVLYHVKDDVYEAGGQLKNLEEELEAFHFARCDNSFLVNLRHVTEVYQSTVVAGRDRIPVSRRRKKEFMKILADFMGGGF